MLSNSLMAVFSREAVMKISGLNDGSAALSAAGEGSKSEAVRRSPMHASAVARLSKACLHPV